MRRAGKCKVALVPKEKVGLVEAAYRAALEAKRNKEDAEAAKQASTAASRFAGRSAGAGAATAPAPATPPAPGAASRTIAPVVGVTAGAAVKKAGPSERAAGAGGEPGQAGSALDQLSSIMSQIDHVMKLAPSNTATTKVLFNLAEVSPEEVSGRIRETFDQLDRDQSGSLDKDEFLEGCALLGKKVSAEEVEAWIAEADVDGNGTIDKEEFEHCTRQAFSLLCSAQCTICCMNLIAVPAPSSPSPPKSARCTGGGAPTLNIPRGPTDGRAPVLNFSVRQQIKERMKNNHHIKGLAGSIFESSMLHKQLEQMTTGFRRTYSAPSPMPDEQRLQGQDTPPHDTLEEQGLEGQQEEAQAKEHDATESEKASEPDPQEPASNHQPTPEPEKSAPKQPVPERCLSRQEQHRQAAAELKEELARIRARGARAFRSSFSRTASLPSPPKTDT